MKIMIHETLEIRLDEQVTASAVATIGSWKAGMITSRKYKAFERQVGVETAPRMTQRLQIEAN